MNNIKEVIEAIFIGLALACFLVTTSRALKAIELYKECLFILNNIAVIMEQRSATFLYKTIYWNMWQACRLVNDNKNAMKYLRKIIRICHECVERSEEYKLSINLATMYFDQSNYVEAKELYEKALEISKEIGEKKGEAICYKNIGAVYYSVDKYQKAIEYFVEAQAIFQEIGDREGEAACYENLGNVYDSVGEYQKSIEYHEKSLKITKEIGYRKVEAISYANLGAVFYSLGEYLKARQHYEKSLEITKEIGDRSGEANCCGNLGAVYQSVGEYQKARTFHEKSLEIREEIFDRNGEATCYNNLGSMCRLVGKYPRAREYYEKSLAIMIEIGYRKGEACCYRNLGTVYQLLGKYQKARKYHEEALKISNEIGDRNGEAACYENLGSVDGTVGEYQKSKINHEKSLAIRKEIGDRNGEAYSYGNLGAAYGSVGKYQEAREYHEKSLAIVQQIGDRNGEASSFRSLGFVCQSVGEYQKAEEYHQKSLAIVKQIGDRNGEAGCYGNLGALCVSVAEYEKARVYYEEALAIEEEIGDRKGEAISYHRLGTLDLRHNNYEEADQNFNKALTIATELGDKRLEASSYGQKGVVEWSVGNYDKAKEYLEKALEISKNTLFRAEEAATCINLGILFCELDEYVKAEEYIKKGLEISEEIEDVLNQALSLSELAILRKKEGKIDEAISYFLPAIKKVEDLRSFLRDNDQFKISFSDCHIHSYRQLSALLCGSGKPNEALYVAELGRASALTDLMSARYSEVKQISADPDTWAGIEKVMDNERNCSCLYVSYFFDIVYLWIVKATGVTHFRKVNGRELISQEGLNENLDEFFGSKSFRSFGILPGELCEDRSLNFSEQETDLCMEDSLADGLRMEKEGQDKKGPKMDLPLCYKLIITPVVDLLEGNEIIIVPDRSLYNIPFAALPDKKGKYLSETFRIRLIPSLTTLKLIHDSPADYHSQTGALIVGNPAVGDVVLNRRRITISRLPCAENEAKMIGKMLGVKPLVGPQATKQAVLEVINSVSLIHLAAHGNAERGEIALAPAHRTPGRRPREKDYLLTMSDISKVRLRAKLVVLSCCHSARGKIKAEGAVGIARALLGSGARSVLVSLWAVDDGATEKLMSHFYKCLVRGESASESLHNAMQRTRLEGYSHVSQWAPFVLIGDNVTFDFEKQGFVVAKKDQGSR